VLVRALAYPELPSASFNASARYSFFESTVEVPRVKHGNKQTVETLINEEALLFARYLRSEQSHWLPRVPSYIIAPDILVRLK